jgi:hypothetical protein
MRGSKYFPSFRTESRDVEKSRERPAGRQKAVNQATSKESRECKIKYNCVHSRDQ